jgi:hypothetical protein
MQNLMSTATVPVIPRQADTDEQVMHLWLSCIQAGPEKTSCIT